MTRTHMNRAAVVGAGPAGLIAAERLAAAGVSVTVYDRMPSVGRKFLLAGRGGLNLTHSEPLERFLGRYHPQHAALRAAIAAFPPQRLRDWCEALGQPTFVGTSGRVFPKAMKASPLLRVWLKRLGDAGVTFAMRHRFTGWQDGALAFARPGGTIVTDRPDVTVLALGGASWPRLGSDGGWVTALLEAGIAISPLQPANSGFRVQWSEPFRSRRAGSPLKRIAVTFGRDNVRGEAVLTADGIEGGAIYALSAPFREAIVREGSALLTLDLRPDLTQADLAARLAKGRAKESLSNTLRKNARLSPAAIDLLREVAIGQGRQLATLPPGELAAFIKSVPLRLTDVADIARAISTAGGISFDEINERFMLRKLPGVYVAGEMLDWEAPTGGYLLQASFATGVAAAEGALACLKGTIEQSTPTRV
jgi:uncharacterized flavoprotein (TIGR03862 family)